MARVVNNELRERRTRLVRLFVGGSRNIVFTPQRRPSRPLSLVHVLTTKLDIESAASVRISPFLSPSTSRRRTRRPPTHRPTPQTARRKEREGRETCWSPRCRAKSCSSAIVIVAARATLSLSPVGRNFPLLISRAREILGVSGEEVFRRASRRRRARDIQSMQPGER